MLLNVCCQYIQEEQADVLLLTSRGRYGGSRKELFLLFLLLSFSHPEAADAAELWKEIHQLEAELRSWREAGEPGEEETLKDGAGSTAAFRFGCFLLSYCLGAAERSLCSVLISFNDAPSVTNGI